MAKQTWVPPIPTEKLYSAPAMKLGAGLVLLIWCYDGIERDGTVRIEIGRAANALGKPYRTVKDWWQQLREGPFFSNVQDRGKLGFVVTFNKDWIEWRVMKTNYPTEENGQGHPDVFEETEEVVQSPVKAASKPGQGQSDVFETPAYKVLNISGDQDLPVSSDDEPAPPIAEPKKTPKPVTNRKPRSQSPGAPPTPIEIRQAYAEVCDVDISPGAKPPVKLIALLNNEAKMLWEQQQGRHVGIEATVLGIHETAAYTRATDWRFKDSAVRLLIPLIRENWTAAGRWKKARTSAVNGTNGHHTEPFDYSTLSNGYDEQAERQRIAAERRAARKAGAP